MNIQKRFVVGIAAAILSGFLLAIGILLIISPKPSDLDVTPTAGVVMEITSTASQSQGGSIIDALTGQMSD